MAESSSSLQWLIDMLVPAMESTRHRRISIENEWLLNYQAWQGWPAQRYMLQLPDNAIHYFIPHARRAVERNVKRGTKLLMPNMDWHQTIPFDGKSHENAEAVHAVMRYVYAKKLNTKHNISTILRCLQLYNFAAIHTSAIIDNEEVWPYQSTVDPFNFYVFPDTASNAREALLIFEDSIIPYQVYNSYVDKDKPESSLYKPIDVDELEKPVWPYHLVERLAYRGLTNPSDAVQGPLKESDIRNQIKETNDTLAKQSKAFVALSKVYFRVSSHWYYAVICTNVKGKDKHNCKVVRLDDTENRPLYHWSNTRPLPGELYTNSPMDDIRVLQNLTNTAISQVESNRTLHAEPPLIMNSNAISRTESKVFANRKIWLTDGNPNELIKSLDVEDTATNGIRAWQIYLGLLDKGSGGGIAEGQPGRNMPRAGFAANTLLNVALIDIEDDADTVEQELLTPALADVYHIILEYVPDSQLIKIPNRNPKLIKAYKKRDLEGDYSFTWQGSLGFQDTQVRADKFMQFLQVILNPTALQVLLPQLQEQKQTIDFVHLIKTVYAYGLGERGLGDIIIPMTPEQLQASAQQTGSQEQSQQAEQQMNMQQHQQDMQKGQLDLAQSQSDLQSSALAVKGQALDNQSKQVDTLLQSLRPTGANNA